MKLKHLFLTVSVMALFSSCSNDELVSESASNGDAIAFSVTTNNATRTADYWCNNNLPHFFEVSATYKNEGATSATTYFDGEMYSQNADGEYIQNDGNYRFWPAISESNPLNVWAYKVKAETKNADNTYTIGSSFIDEFKFNDGAPTITMTPKQKAADQHDLLYAYTQVKTKPAFGTTATINFRHALSQIVFYAKCENTKIYVEIEEIALMNAATSGKFTLPTGTNTTDGNLQDHTQGGTAKDTGLGTWKLTYNTASQANRSYTASCLTSDSKLTYLTPGKTSWTNLTDQVVLNEAGTDYTYSESNYGESLLVLPHGKNTSNTDQKLAAYVPASGKLETAGGACIAIKCRIRNISGDSVTGDDIYLWGSAPTEENSGAVDLVVPVDFAWEQGKKYIYRINFSQTGHGGYDPGTGDKVLIPIKLEVTVDDFAKVTDIVENI
ncbi:MAG: fimbrillin family protein [Candidatus Limisoma sp.]